MYFFSMLVSVFSVTDTKKKETWPACRDVLFYPLPQTDLICWKIIRTDGSKTAVLIFILSLTAVTERGRTFGCWGGRHNSLRVCHRLIGSAGYYLPTHDPTAPQQCPITSAQCAGTSAVERQGGSFLSQPDNTLFQEKKTPKHTNSRKTLI